MATNAQKKQNERLNKFMQMHQSYTSGQTVTGQKDNDTVINSFLRDSQNYIREADSELKRMSWKDATDPEKQNTRNKVSNNISQRSKQARSILESSKDNIDPDRYKVLMEYLDDFDNDVAAIGKETENLRSYYSKWKREEEYTSDYQNYVNQKRDREEKGKFDLISGQKEIDDLESELKRLRTEKITQAPRPYAVGQTAVDDAQYTTGYGITNNRPYAAGQQAQRENTPTDDRIRELEMQIAQKKQYFNQAKHIQEINAYDDTVKNADFDKYDDYAESDDTLYNWINNPQFRESYEASYQSIPNPNARRSKYTRKGYDRMSASEIAIYNYYYAKSGKEAAQKYLDTIQERLNERTAEEMYSTVQDDVAAELVFGAAAGFNQFGTNVAKRIRKEYRENSQKKQQEIIQRYQDSRKRSVENRNKTAMRHKIRKTIRELDKLLNRGSKERNVKEGMRDFVAEALASAEVHFIDDYSNEDIIRNGVGCDTEPWESKLIDETQVLMQRKKDLYIKSAAMHEVDDVIAGNTVSFDARQKEADKLDRKIAENMRQAYFDSDLDRYNEIFDDIFHEDHFEHNDIHAAIMSEVGELEKKNAPEEVEEEDEAEKRPLYSAESYFNALLAGNKKSANLAYDRLVEAELDEGYLSYEAENNVKSALASQIGSAYKDGKINRETALKLLKENTDKDETNVKKWDFEIKFGYPWSGRDRAYRKGVISESKLIDAIMDIEGEGQEAARAYIKFIELASDHSDLEITADDAADFYEIAQPAKISLESFLEFKQNLSVLTVDKDKNGQTINGSKKKKVMDLIDNMNLSAHQKDALYYAAGYKESTIYEAPWH